MNDPNRYHVGWPHKNVRDVLDKVKKGLPVYWPTHPVDIDQTPYIAFAAKRPPNSE